MNSWLVLKVHKVMSLFFHRIWQPKLCTRGQKIPWNILQTSWRPTKPKSMGKRKTPLTNSPTYYLKEFCTQNARRAFLRQKTRTRDTAQWVFSFCFPTVSFSEMNLKMHGLRFIISVYFLLRLWERRALKRSRLDFENLGELAVSLILPTFSQRALENKLWELARPQADLKETRGC